MDNFSFYSPTFFVFGKDTERETGKNVKRFGGTKVLIHYGGGSVVRSGLLNRVKISLEEESIEYVMLGGVKPNPRSGLVYEGIELCKKEGVDFVLAVEEDKRAAVLAVVVLYGDRCHAAAVGRNLGLDFSVLNGDVPVLASEDVVEEIVPVIYHSHLHGLLGH